MRSDRTTIVMAILATVAYCGVVAWIIIFDL